MIKILQKALLILVFLLVWIHLPAQVTIHDLLGRWKMQTVYVDGVEVTHQYIPDEKRWIEFNADFSFVSDGESFGRKKGTFTLDEDSGLLSFNLDIGFGEKSFWHVEFDGRNMIWTDRGNPMVDKIKIILVHAY